MSDSAVKRRTEKTQIARREGDLKAETTASARALRRLLRGETSDATASCVSGARCDGVVKHGDESEREREYRDVSSIDGRGLGRMRERGGLGVDKGD